MCGLSPYYIRMLCENTFNGGKGYSPHTVGDMTLDEAFMNLTDPKYLRKEAKVRAVSVPAAAGAVRADEDGKVRGRAADGSPIRGIIRGKSKARQLMEAKASRENSGTAADVGPETPRQRRARQRAERAAQRATRAQAQN